MNPRRSAALLLAALLAPGGAAAQPAPAAPPAPQQAPAPPPAAQPPPSSAPAAPADPAKAAYDAARVLYEDGDYAGALLAFQRAYDLSGNTDTLWNMALCEKNLRHYARAIRLLERYQVEGGERLTDEDRKGALYLVNTMRAFVSTLKLSADERGATVFVDDEPVGTTPLGRPLLVDMGYRRIRVTKKGFLPFDERRQVVGGMEIDLHVQLEPEIHEGRLEVAAGAQDLIWLDGRIVGQTRYAGAVPSGGHTLRVTAPGMQPYQSEVVIQDDKLRRIQVTLQPAPRAGGLPSWLLVAGGAALAAGVGFTAGYLLFQAGEPEPQTRGNLAPYAIVIR